MIIMGPSGLLLGVINIGIVAAGWILVGYVIVWLVKWLAGQDVPADVRKAYMVMVALIVIYMVAALFFGLPTLRII